MDVQALRLAPWVLLQGAKARLLEKLLQGMPAQRYFATACPELETLHVEARPLGQPVSPLEPPPEQEPEPGAQSSLSPLRPSPLPPLPPPLPVRENVFAPARRAQYQSNSSASSFP